MAAGKERQFWRIREFLDGLDLNMAEVGRAVGVTRNLVRETAQGKRNNRKVLGYLHELGCPEKWLDLPEDMKGRRAA
jgi:transcriptional regulator with XRE-family HTH domain